MTALIRWARDAADRRHAAQQARTDAEVAELLAGLVPDGQEVEQ